MTEEAAPPSEEFAKVLKDRIAGLSYIASSQSATKSKKMSWCLAEALREGTKSALLHSKVIAIHQDARNGLLMVRFSSCDQNLKVTKGILGIAQDYGTTAVDTVHATVAIARDAFARQSKGPASNRPPAPPGPSQKSVSMTEFWNKVELFDADGASDEQLAGKMLRGLVPDPSAGPHVRAVAPNLRIQLRDRTHASTRVLKVPWNVDEYWRSTFYWFTNVAKLIGNSPDLKGRFKVAISRQAKQHFKSKRLADMSYAKQRMSSTQRPLARGVLFMDALIGLCNEVRQTRGKIPKGRAQKFIDEVCPERLMTLALLADTGDECAALIRFFDKSDYDLTAVPLMIRSFTQRVDQLFVQGKVLETPSSYCGIMLKYLETPRLLPKSSGPATLGGRSAVEPAVLQRCKQRMNAWALLALKQLQARQGTPNLSKTAATC